MSPALAERLTEYLDRAACIYRWPLQPPPETHSPEYALEWMHAERLYAEWWHPDQIRITPDQLVRLGIARREVLAAAAGEVVSTGRGNSAAACSHAQSARTGGPR